MVYILVLPYKYTIFMKLKKISDLVIGLERKQKVGKNYAIKIKFKKPILDMCKVKKCVEKLKKEGFNVDTPPGVKGGIYAVSISKIGKETMPSHYTQILNDEIVTLTLDPAGKKIFREIMRSCLKRILVVDDEDNIGVLFSKILTREGYPFKICNNGCGALKELTDEDYYLLITDHRMPSKDGMPNMNGDELINRIKETKPEIKTMIMSGGTFRKEDKEKNSNIGMFLGKPFTVETLVKTVKDIF